MSGARIRRGEAPRSRPRTAARRGRKPSRLARMIAAIPVEADTIRRATSWAALMLVIGVAIGVVQMLGLFALAWVSVAEAAGRAGLRVEHVDVQGLKRMDDVTVYAVALDQKSTAMPLVELEPIRQRLLSYGWIADARVSRRLPDTLVIDIVEREPAAVWQHRGRLMLVDAGGVPLEPVGAEAMPDLPLLIGADANRQAARLERLLATTPALRSMLGSATWVGGRRWNLAFQSGETLLLPEGEGPARTALVKFAGLDAKQRLLGQGFERFDMRDPTRMVVRVNRDGRTIDGEGRPVGGDDDGAPQVARATT